MDILPVIDSLKTILGGIIGGVASGATISAYMNYRWNARAAKIAHLKEQLKEFYAPIDNLAMQLLHKYRVLTETTKVCLTSDPPIPSQAHHQAIDHNNKLHQETKTINDQIKQVYDKNSYLMDGEDRALFAQFLEDMQRDSAFHSLPLDVNRGMPSAVTFRESFCTTIAERYAAKQAQLKQLLGHK